ncbi:hypothetical protein [Streptomyces sp. MspMP-M5]|uniref:hypothetical protein n=1 Tax=Streptomyces sp. MspMP-M5 TaxID=1155718 RepID=UPI0003A28AA3|nr:hypothetical protein [Streptomyces sp. MspMP-M5]
MNGIAIDVPSKNYGWVDFAVVGKSDADGSTMATVQPGTVTDTNGNGSGRPVREPRWVRRVVRDLRGTP